jgi:hypothetical protein
MIRARKAALLPPGTRDPGTKTSSRFFKTVNGIYKVRRQRNRREHPHLSHPPLNIYSKFKLNFNINF